jgi:hypothetical protein
MPNPLCMAGSCVPRTKGCASTALYELETPSWPAHFAFTGCATAAAVAALLLRVLHCIFGFASLGRTHDQLGRSLQEQGAGAAHKCVQEVAASYRECCLHTG